MGNADGTLSFFNFMIGTKVLTKATDTFITSTSSATVSPEGSTSETDASETTCGEIKKMYKMNECCGNPGKQFRTGRRLSATYGGELNNQHLLQEIKDALETA